MSTCIWARPVPLLLGFAALLGLSVLFGPVGRESVPSLRTLEPSAHPDAKPSQTQAMPKVGEDAVMGTVLSAWEPRVLWSGRTVAEPGRGVVLDWPGVRATVAVRNATAVWMVFDDASYTGTRFNVYLVSA
jgi:hypothetical protein